MASHKECIVEIELCSSTKLGNHEIDRRQDTNTKARFVNDIDGTIPISRWHGDHRPTGEIRNVPYKRSREPVSNIGAPGLCLSQ